MTEIPHSPRDLQDACFAVPLDEVRRRPGTVHGRSIPLLVAKFSGRLKSCWQSLAPVGQPFRSLKGRAR